MDPHSCTSPLPQALKPSITTHGPHSPDTPSSFSCFFSQAGTDTLAPITSASPLPQGLHKAAPRLLEKEELWHWERLDHPGKPVVLASVVSALCQPWLSQPPSLFC